MKSVSTPFPKPATSLEEKRLAISDALTQCRQQIENLTAEIDFATLTKQSHPDFSPIGWHLGHIAFTEAYWILEQLGGFSPLYPEYHKLFAADGLPKAERENLPSLPQIKEYLDTVRSKTFKYLETAPLENQERLWWWLIQHELQHGETIAFVKKLHRLNHNLDFVEENNSISALVKEVSILIPQGSFVIGSDAIEAQDNERPAHLVYLDSYYIDAYPVTCGQYQQFMTANGYSSPQYWSKQGWQWKQKNAVFQPLYWSKKVRYQNHPVCGVSYYEAEAYANFIGKRLPTEAEWEKAAQLSLMQQKDNQSLLGNHSNIVGHTTPIHRKDKNKDIGGCYDMLGNVWEWTNSWFAPYQGFASYPYKGYSEVYFDSQHKVLKGGSYITLPYGIRSSFRNWYHPWVRQMFAGFRCAKDIT